MVVVGTVVVVVPGTVVVVVPGNVVVVVGIVVVVVGMVVVVVVVPGMQTPAEHVSFPFEQSPSSHSWTMVLL